ncbi:uncharacterized protein LOC125201369 isoform X3 [Salvia hispanica]|uniref:uncharacterized protein LOC125201369 isoform X3 n=1 Tax=Salvia hispanica TaxID=49212 RepID=UPI0020093C5E|nr:uncharacterized protein LOC125201369 isoform X3 [Salvia hispanica]
MAVEASLGSSVASPSAEKLTGKPAVGSQVSGDGVHCHQCRQKARVPVAACKNHMKKKPCLVKICSRCLWNRYKEKVEEVASLEGWKCPKCRGICNCSVCMKRRGHQPTGPAKATGFSSVTEMLTAEDSDNGKDVLSARKKGKERLNADDNTSSKRMKHSKLAETSQTIPKEIVLPVGTDLTSVAGIDVPAEDVGNALEFLEFCYVFGEILKLKDGEALCVLRNIVFHRLTAKRGRSCPVVMFHVHLLSIIKEEEGEKFPKPHPREWFSVLKKCLAESERVLKVLGMSYLEKAADYDALNASQMLRVVNLLCIHVLGTKKLRNWIEHQKTQFDQKAKEAKLKVFEARGEIKILKQKIKEDTAKAIDARDREQEVIVSLNRSAAEQAHGKLIESEAMLLKIDQTADAIRVEPIFTDCSGHMYWKLKCADESDVLHQDVGKGDTLTLQEKWFALSVEERKEIVKNITTRYSPITVVGILK